MSKKLELTETQKELANLLQAEDLILVPGTFEGVPVAVVAIELPSTKFAGGVPVFPVAILLDRSFIEKFGSRIKGESGESPYVPSAAETALLLHPEKAGKA